MKFRCCLLLAVTSIACAQSATAAPLLTGGTETTVSNWGASFNWGYDFTPNSNLQLTSMGMWDESSNGLPGAYQVGLWLTSTQTLLASVTIDSADPLDNSLTLNGGQWRYEAITPVSLASGTTYTMSFFTGTTLTMSVADSYLGDYSTVTSDSAVTLGGQGRRLSSSVFAFPTNTTPSAVFFPMQINAQISVPEPGSAGLLLGGLGLLGLRRRRG